MEPVRTCVGCRLRAPRASLLRLVLHSNVLAVDPYAVRPGRGAWLHDAVDCYELAVKRRAFGRAFRTRESVDVSELEQYLTRSDRLGPSSGGPGAAHDHTRENRQNGP
ncbi:DUF448 domain-containing protein [Rathayibacter rathayi]|uniref:DUF448 domain-containing protein n=1 Tax=Rathayibacter rathayi TaxID=33887 RepID=A0ABD6WCP6_RATRA|nr:YlxR family protein [Rathayibacter rathayi]AZZ49148.1 DUF448 domain-containing protein [Rathayibacter rathayi]MWV73205.1 DUF448 domain-containing protein [Rathayibacter rathayi NCPPB 2980 = VKM Ac-1601]PPF16297.1 DUF448 domain-containing protein [Rathayibacter rathayi]PPF25567.1 DUF448 domain-containing protein [Rathayibacter rathayi]PPF51871.1 DUF448 domain-containing protein [Rathayibacter rathayi]